MKIYLKLFCGSGYICYLCGCIFKFLTIMSRYTTRGHCSGLDELERLSMKTTYKGVVMTVAEANRKKAAERRKQNAAERKKSNEWRREDILPGVLKQIENTRKSTRCLKSICAFVDNGPIQWPGDYKLMMKLYPKVQNAFWKYHAQYKKIEETEKKLTQMIKRSKTNKNFFSLAQEFGYQMFDLLDMVRELADAIQKDRVCDCPVFYNKEIIIGAADGKRKGLRHILSSTYGNLTTTRNNLVSLSKSLEEAYEDVVVYNENSRYF